MSHATPTPPLQPALTANSTIAQAIGWAADQLTTAGVAFGHGTTNATDEAAWLVLWKMGLPLYTDWTDDVDEADASTTTPCLPRVTEHQAQHIMALIAQRIHTRKPAAYLTGEAWLQGVPFDVEECTIVPRSLIAEILTEGTADEFLHPNTCRVLDLCTGNGSLAVLAAMAYPDVHVTGADICKKALAVAQRNVNRHELQERIALVQSDGLSNAPGPWDLIICNPPYVNSTSMSKLPPEYGAEPELALAGGVDGMDFIRPLLQACAQHLTEHGVLLLEIGNECDFFEAAFPSLPVNWLHTSAGDDQVLLITREALQMAG